jgi:myo-inositol-1(or 4)-monophosphatase
MSSAPHALEADWLGASRRSAAALGRLLDEHPTTRERIEETGRRGEGGDRTLVIDQLAEDAVFAELDELYARGARFTVVSEERGEVDYGGDGVRVVVDPLDGSRNAKRGLPPWSVSIAVAGGDRLGDVDFAYVRDCVGGEEWWARAGEGAFHDGGRIPPLDPEAGLEMVGLEFIHPALVAESAAGLAATGASRLRALGSIALTLCYVACGRLDGMVTLAGCRSVDIAAGQLIVREAGGVLAYPDDGPDPLRASLGLDWRSRVFAAAGPGGLERLLTAG